MRAITYKISLEYLYKSYEKGIKVGLDGVKSAMAVMGNPHLKIPVIHVAGTNGKGSTCAYLQHILTAAGYKVGTFTSPHLNKYNERMTINNEPISDKDFAEQVGLVDSAIKKSGIGRMSFFEILTCMAYNYFYSCKVDIAIMETGIGGRLDSTNIIEKPLLSVITAPGYDHQELLGETLAEITTEDAGIIKEGCPVAVYPNSEISVITNVAKERNAALYYIGANADIYDVEYGLEATYFSVNSPYFSYEALKIGLLGEHQLHNAVNALLCIEALKRDRGIAVSDGALRKGLGDCKWPGRFEPVSDKPVIILDGAHNEDGAIVFSKALRRYFSDKNIVLVLGISYHKDRDVILKNILTEADTVICTCSDFKATPAEELSSAVAKHTTVPVLTEPDCRKALTKAVELAEAERKSIVAVAGSLYLAGELRQAVLVDRMCIK